MNEREIRIDIAFGPRLAWVAAALLYLACPRWASTGDIQLVPQAIPAPSSIYQDLYSLGNANIGTDPGSLLLLAQDAGKSVGISVVPGTGQTAASYTFPNDANSQKPALVVNGNVRVTGCIWLNRSPKCNGCSASNPSLGICGGW